MPLAREVVEELAAAAVADPQGVEVPGGVGAGPGHRQRELVDAGEAGVVAGVDLVAAGLERPEPAQLVRAERGQDVGQAVVQPERGDLVEPGALVLGAHPGEGP